MATKRLPALKYGDTGDAVLLLQHAMKVQGFFEKGSPRGNFLELTQEAVENGISVSSYIRQIAMARNAPNSGRRQGLLDPDSDFANTIATILAMDLLIGTLSLKGLETELRETKEDILNSMREDL